MHEAANRRDERAAQRRDEDLAQREDEPQIPALGVDYGNLQAAPVSFIHVTFHPAWGEVKDETPCTAQGEGMCVDDDILVVPAVIAEAEIEQGSEEAGTQVTQQQDEAAREVAENVDAHGPVGDQNFAYVGGGASIMGTLSGGGNIVISLGEKCLLGANSGVGIPLGDRCTVEAGLYITAGTIITLINDQKEQTGKIKARELAGNSDLLFRRNSVTGTVECLTNKSVVELNSELHASN